METDLSLIEMSIEEEDESLLLLGKDIKEKEGNSDASLHDLDFSCSPLYTLRSKRSSADSTHPPLIPTLSDGSEVNEGGKKPSCSSPPPSEEDTVDNKENLDKINLLVSPNLKAGQQQMKRRKKGGGFHMRKSIAWNRAFFTEEGVLDPEELSLLSESFSKPSTGSLYTVEEEGGTSLSECSISSGNGSNVHTNEEKLFKEFPATPSDEVHKVSGGLLPKPKSSVREDAAPLHGASKKVQSTKGFHRVGSRQGSCPQPAGSTSQKQLLNRNTRSATKKESKLPKFSAPKPDSSSLPTAPKTLNLSVKQSRPTQTRASAIHAGRNSSLKGNLSNTKKLIGCTPSSTKSSVHSSLKVLANSHLETQKSANPKTLQDKKGANNGLKVTPNLTTPAADMQASTGQAGLGNMAVLLPQKCKSVGSDNQYNVNVQPTKPSGLRMPSPSLRYFDQPKTSALRGLQCQKSTQSYSRSNANIPNLRKVDKSENIGMVTALHAPLPMLGPDATTTRTIGHLNSSCSIPYVAPATSSGNIGEVKMLHAQSRLPIVGTAAVSNNDTVSMNSILGCSTPSAPGSSHPTPKAGLELKNQYEEEIEVPSHINDNYDTINCWEQQSHGVSDCSNKESANLADEVNPFFDKIDHSPHEDKQRFHMNDNMLLVQSGSSEKSHKSNDFVNHHDVCPQNGYSSSSASEISHALSPSISTMAEKGGFSGKNALIKYPNFEGVALESISCSGLNENHDIFPDTVLSDAIKCCNPVTSAPSADCLPADHGLCEESNEHPTPKSSLELKSQYKVEIEVPSHLNDTCDRINCREQQSHVVSDCSNKESANLADVGKPILDEINHSPQEDKQRFHMKDNMLLVQSGSSEQSHKSNDFVNHHDVCPQNGYSSSSASEISHALSPSISTMGEKGGFSGKNALIKYPNFEGVALESISCSGLNENHDIFPDTVLSDAIECCNLVTTAPSADCLPAGHGLREESKEQLVDREPGAYEFFQTFHKDNLTKQMKGNNYPGQRTEEFQEENDNPSELDIEQNFYSDYERFETNDGNMVGQGRSSEEFQEVNKHSHVSDLTPKSRVSVGTEFQSSHFSSNLTSVSKVQVGTTGTGNVIKNSNVEDPKLDSLHGDLSLDSVDQICDPQLEDVACKCNASSSVLHNDCLKIIGDEYSGNQLVLRNSFPNKIKQMLEMDECTLLMGNEALLAEIRSSKEPQNDNDPDNFINITLKRKDCYGSESQSPHVLSQLKLAKKDIEGSAETSKETKQLHVQDAAQLNVSADRNVLLDDINADLPHNDSVQDGKLQSVTENGFPMKVNETGDPVEEKIVDGSKPDSLTLQNVVPFSDEWLAALETAGEEILTRKSGAVQNSPPDKSLPEPSPWSPVKRKANQEIGPFDCTKYTNLPSSPR
ncbi:uncharacterized protein LOC122058219 isoform X2 [Macadamia integrifolia]|uniref:uncharacterized protein LOC122058219 isoform X2 n=1 Tax=Macadamia integrifolia TaxID=60698 RepID=UPI001C530E86|nr:uncharacterized protein LOC122058219 isoform X2 [Macadamia integrifolia]